MVHGECVCVCVCVCVCEREREIDVTLQQIAGSSGKKQKGVLQQAERTQAIKCMNRDTVNLIIAQDTAEKERANMSETQRQRNSHLMSTFLPIFLAVVITFTWLCWQTHNCVWLFDYGVTYRVASCVMLLKVRGARRLMLLLLRSLQRKHTQTHSRFNYTPSEQHLQHAFTIQSRFTLRKEI